MVWTMQRKKGTEEFLWTVEYEQSENERVSKRRLYYLILQKMLPSFYDYVLITFLEGNVNKKILFTSL